MRVVKVSRVTVPYQAATEITLPLNSEHVRGTAARVLRDQKAGIDLGRLPSPRRVAWEYLSAVIAAHGGNFSAAAKATGIPRRSIQRIMLKRAPTR